VYATDLSPLSIQKAREYAAQFKVDVQFAAADVRQLASSVEGQFDIVVSFDNALPHLLADEDLRLAANNIFAKVKPGGLFTASIRDYDHYVQEKPHATEPRVYDSPGERRIVLQVWDWSEDGKTYTLQHFIVRGSGQTWQTTFGETVYRALLRDELSRFLSDAGFSDIRWHMPQDTGNYLPIVTAKRG
jgi:SAM-dependent methyltransferase